MKYAYTFRILGGCAVLLAWIINQFGFLGFCGMNSFMGVMYF